MRQPFSMKAYLSLCILVGNCASYSFLLGNFWTLVGTKSPYALLLMLCLYYNQLLLTPNMEDKKEGEGKKTPPPGDFPQQQYPVNQIGYQYLNDTGFDYQEPNIDTEMFVQQQEEWVQIPQSQGGQMEAGLDNINQDANMMEDEVDDNDEYGEEELDEGDYYQPPPVPSDAQPTTSTKICIPLFGGPMPQPQVAPQVQPLTQPTNQLAQAPSGLLSAPSQPQFNQTAPQNIDFPNTITEQQAHQVSEVQQNLMQEQPIINASFQSEIQHTQNQVSQPPKIIESAPKIKITLGGISIPLNQKTQKHHEPTQTQQPGPQQYVPDLLTQQAQQVPVSAPVVSVSQPAPSSFKISLGALKPPTQLAQAPAAPYQAQLAPPISSIPTYQPQQQVQLQPPVPQASIIEPQVAQPMTFPSGVYDQPHQILTPHVGETPLAPSIPDFTQFPMDHQHQPQQPSFYPQASLIDTYNFPQQQEQDLTKRPKKDKKKRIKGKGDLREYYDLVKGKVLLEFNLHEGERRARGQATYVFKVKPEEEVKETLTRLREEDTYSKMQVDIRFNAKQMQIEKVGIVKAGEVERVKHEYPQKEQISYQQEVFGNISHDLYTYESVEKKQYEIVQNEPNLYVKKAQSISFKKENLYEQLDKEVRICISYYLPVLNDFGIQSVNYRKFDQIGSGNSADATGTYFFTQDRYDSQPLWMPLVHGSTFMPMNWSFKFIVPPPYTVVASGKLYIKQVEQGENPRQMFHYKMKDNEIAPAVKIGFIIANFPYIHVMNEIPKVRDAHAFLLNSDKYAIFSHQNKFYEKTLSGMENDLQKLVGAPFPFESLKIVFVPNLFLKKSRKQSVDFTGGLHILDEELLFPKTQQEGRHRTYKYLACSLAYDFFGAKVYEDNPSDFWLLQGIRESIGNHQKIMRFGILLYRYHIMKTIDSVYKKAKHGYERYPLQSLQLPNPSEYMLNELVYEKSELIMHMIESMIDKQYFERIIRDLYHQSSPFVTTKSFQKIFKQVCGMKLKDFSMNWISATSCLTLSVSCVYNKKNNSLDLKLQQDSAMKDHFAFRKYLQEGVDLGDLLSRPFVRKDKIYMSDQQDQLKTSLKNLESIGKFTVDLKREAQRWFVGEVNVMLYVTDGADISTQQQKMNLKWQENEVSINIPLSVKVKKTIQNKKKEYESMQMYGHGDEDEDGDNDISHDNNKGGAGGLPGTSHLIDNSQWKFGLNDLELEDYPLETKNIFEVKNLESSVLWIRVDPDMEYIRKVKVKQEHNNWLFQLLLEKDIIGQIEAIRQLYKLTTHQQFIYQILQSVSTNEGYYFKVRKVALKYMQKMQTSQFNEFLSHEKFIIKIFNQRNFDESLGFYKSNDFTKILEYFFDKYLLKTLAKCQEIKLPIRQEVREKLTQLNQANQQKPVVSATDPGQITISVQGDLTILKRERLPREYLTMMSSDQIAQLFLKLLKENDNSENYYDDANYLKTIIECLGNVLNFKYMPEIAQEIYRQFKLDQIGRFSLQFSIIRGAISGFFKMKKQLYLLKTEKLKYLDPMQVQDKDYYDDQIFDTEVTLNQMGQDLEKILDSPSWPYEIRAFITDRNIKHCFQYEGNPFLKALYIQLKVIDKLQFERRIRDTVDHARALVLYLEGHIKILDFREALLDSARSKAIVEVIWNLLSLSFNYLDCSLSFWVKRLYYYLYGGNVPSFLKSAQDLSGVHPELIECDPYWLDETKGSGLINMGGDQMMTGGMTREMLAKTRQQKLMQKVVGASGPGQKGAKMENGIRVGDYGPNGERIDKTDIKLRIYLQPDTAMKTQTSFNQLPHNQVPAYQEMQRQQSGIKISLGGANISKNQNATGGPIQIPNLQAPIGLGSSMIQIGLQQPQQTTSISFRNPLFQGAQPSDVDMINANQPSQEQQDQMQLMLILTNTYEEQKGGKGNRNEDQAMLGDDNASVYDEFAEISFQTEWVQKLWDVTGHIWYHEESQAFLYPVTPEDLGGKQAFNYYLTNIIYPMDLTTIKEKVKQSQYLNVRDWRQDIEIMFANCRMFNEESSDIHQSAIKLENFYFAELRQYELIDTRKNVRVIKS